MAGSAGLNRVSADVAQLVEHSLGKGEVTSSILVIGSISSLELRVPSCEWIQLRADS